MKILLATDSFPPVCGGSGWSTYELARGLRDRGHTVAVVQPKPGMAGTQETAYDGFPVQQVGAPAPDIPFVRNYFKSELLTRRLAEHLRDRLAGDRFDIVHGQHVMTAVAAVEAGAAAGVPSVVTVRDYWPVCYWSDLLHTKDGLTLCPACTAVNMARCLAPRAGAFWPATLPLIPYMRANLSSKRAGLARAGAIVAVSRRIAADLRERAPEIAATRMEVIPNPVNTSAIREIAARSTTPPLTGPFALYVGKLAPNKGSDYLVSTVERAGLDWPLVVVGDGPGREGLEREAALSGRPIRFTGWLDRDAAVRLMATASMLIFPSRGPESLSRVLLEASALGLPIAAMDTGGTRDIIEPGVTGLLSTSPPGLADDVRRLREDEALRQRLGAAARQKVSREFETSVVVARIDALYRDVAKPQ